MERHKRIGGGWWGLLWAASLIMALYGGSLLGSASQSPHPSGTPTVSAPKAASAERVPVPVFIPAGDKAVDAATIRQIVREELAEQFQSPCPAPAEQPRAEDQPGSLPESPEAKARADEASRVIDLAVASGRWTKDDRARFATLASALPPPTMFELERRLHAAINRGQVVIDDRLPPFGPPGQAQ
jgi:hypothetical protein